MRAGTPIAEDLQERYAKACALLAEGDRQDFTGKPIALITYRWALSSKEFIERVSASEERERVLREALEKVCPMVYATRGEQLRLGFITHEEYRDMVRLRHSGIGAVETVCAALATPAPEQQKCSHHHPLRKMTNDGWEYWCGDCGILIQHPVSSAMNVSATEQPAQTSAEKAGE